MKILKIGNRDLATITKEEVLQVVMIEGCCAHLDYWDIPELTYFNNTIFSSTVVLEYFSKRKEDDIKGDVFVFFFNHKKFIFHYHNKYNLGMSSSHRLSLDTIKYLLKQGFNLPIY